MDATDRQAAMDHYLWQAQHARLTRLVEPLDCYWREGGIDLEVRAAADDFCDYLGDLQVYWRAALDQALADIQATRGKDLRGHVNATERALHRRRRLVLLERALDGGLLVKALADGSTTGAAAAADAARRLAETLAEV